VWSLQPYAVSEDTGIMWPAICVQTRDRSGGGAGYGRATAYRLTLGRCFCTLVPWDVFLRGRGGLVRARSSVVW